MEDQLDMSEMKIDGEYVLADTYHILFKYLTIKDLKAFALVNRYWNTKATKELLTRGLRVEPLQSTRIYWRKVRTREPCVTFLFAQTKMEQANLEKYRHLFENSLVSLGADVVGLNNKRINNEHALSLVIPQYQDLRIRTAHWYYITRSRSLAENFLPEDSDSKSTILLFIPKEFKFSFIQDLKRSMKERKQKYALWGCDLPNPAVLSVDSRMPLMEDRCFAMSITGQNLESFSTVINCRLQKDEFNKKVLEFREQLRLKRDSICLICGPKQIRRTLWDAWGAYQNCEEFMDFVKGVFPDMPIITLFNEDDQCHYYGVDSTIDDFDQELEHVTTLSIMILTYV